MSLTIPTIFSAVDKLSAPTQKMTANVQSFAQKAESSIARFDRGLHRLTPSLGDITKQLIQFNIISEIGGVIMKTGQNIVEFDKKMASLSAITGVSGTQLDEFRKNIFEVAKVTGKSGIDIAKGFELVGSAKPELLKSAEGLAAVTQAATLMSQASGDEMEVSVQSLVGTMNQFGLAANQASRVVNVLAAGSKEGAAAIPAISEALDKFGVVAASANVSVEQSVGIIETLAEQNIKGAEAGTKLRNVLTKMATVQALPKEALDQLKKYGVNTKLIMDNTVDFSVRLKELSKIQDDATAMAKVFGVENLVAGQILLQNVDKVDKYTSAVTGTNIAQEQADKNMKTISMRLTTLANRFTNVFLESDAVNGKMAVFGKVLDWVTRNMDTLLLVAGALIGTWISLRGVIWASKIALAAYNIALGVMGALSGTASIAIGSNTIALTAYNVATKAAAFATKMWTGAQWLLNIAMDANPIGLVILAVAALIGLVALIINKYDEWGASLALILGPFGLIINMVQAFRRHWDSIVDSFTNGGIIEGLKRIGLVMLDALLMPVQQLLNMLSKVPGLSIAGDFAADIEKFRTDLELSGTTPTVNPKAAEQEAMTQRIEQTTKSNATLTVKAPAGTTSIEKDKNFMPVVTSTMGTN